MDYFPRNDVEFNYLNPVKKSDLKNNAHDERLLGKKYKSKETDEHDFVNKTRRDNKTDKNLFEKENNDFIDDEDTKENTDLIEYGNFDGLINFEKDEKTDKNICPKPIFEKGDLIMLSICEIKKDYMIANYTRNKKAIIHRKYTSFTKDKNFKFSDYFHVGQFVSAAVITSNVISNSKSSVDQIHHKIKCSIEPNIINSNFHLEEINVGLDLWGQLRVINGKFYPFFGFKEKNESNEENDSEITLSLKEDNDEEEEIEEDENNDNQDENDIDNNEDNYINESEDGSQNQENKNAKKIILNKLWYNNNEYLFELEEKTSDIISKQLPFGDINNINLIVKPFSYQFFKVTSITKEVDKPVAKK